MPQKLTTISIILIAVVLLFTLSPISLYGYYSDTVFIVLAMVVMLVSVFFRFKRKLEKPASYLIIGGIIYCCLFVFNDLNFRYWGSVKEGTVLNINDRNQKSSVYKTIVYYQINENDSIGPEECRYWEKQIFKYFPVFEWTIDEGINCCGEI